MRIRQRRSSTERGFVLIIIGVTAIALFGALGVAVDIGRMLITKNETQRFCDSAALSATLRLDGTLDGIAAARAAVDASTNKWNLENSKLSSYSVEFATSKAGPWYSAPTSGANLTHVRVKTTANVPLMFLPVLVHSDKTGVASTAVAAQVGQPKFSRGMAPYTAVSPDPSAPNYGLIVGHQYTIQWPAFNESRAGCSATRPDRCFLRDPCSGDTMAAQEKVFNYWKSSINGYWGSNSGDVIRDLTLNLRQMMPVEIGQYLVMTDGNKAAQAKALDDRVLQDQELTTNWPASYFVDPDRNGRRLIGLPIVDPQAGGTMVVGFGAFLLISEGSFSDYYQDATGNEPFCAVYAGPYMLGGQTKSASSSAGAFRVSLVQ